MGPGGKDLSGLCTDHAWTAPMSNPHWLEHVDYEVVVALGDVIECGVHPAELPVECVDVDGVPAGFFSAPEKFPPSGLGEYGGAPNACTFAADAFTCPQPTSFERARMVSWIHDGFARR
jgi:hypothetical protein